MKSFLNFISTLVALAIGVFFICGVGVSIEAVGFNSNIVIGSMIVFSIPAILSFLLFICSLILKPKLRKQKSVEEILYKKDVFPVYLETTNYLKIAMKNKALSRVEILEFKHMLNKALKKNLKRYKGFKFKNDLHEIYTKLKSHYISMKDIEALRDYLMPFAIAASVSIDNPTDTVDTKNYGHLKVIK